MKKGIILLLSCLSLGFLQAETRSERPNSFRSFYQTEMLKLDRAWNNGWISPRTARVLENNLQNIARFRQRALINGRLSRREALQLNRLRRNYERNFAVAVRSQNTRRWNTRPAPVLPQRYRR